MRKTFFFSLLLVTCMQAAAQTDFGFAGGATFAKTSGSGSGNHVGFYAGGLADFKFGNAGSFRPQLNFIMKGESASSGKGVYNYLELPLNVVYNIPTSIGRFFVGGGPVISYMISGSWTAEGGSKEKIYFAYDHVNQFDYGVNVQGGLKIEGGFFFTVNYTLGLANVWQAGSIGPNKNRAIGIGIGIML
ncbi:MAG: porin family protein [Bacteroidota bacterium]